MTSDVGRGTRWACAAALAAEVLASGVAAGAGTSFVVPDAEPPVALAVAVDERPGVVRLRVALPDDVPPESVEIQVDGRDVMVLMEDVAGRPRHAQSLRLSRAVVVRDAEANYADDGLLTVTLRVGSGG
jgi:hypothetical protein